MTQPMKVWNQCLFILKTVLLAFLAALGGSIPWSILVVVNTKIDPSFPWSVPVMVCYLWFYWKYLRGRGWPRSTAEMRHHNLRAGSLSKRVWGWSLLAGSLALVSLTAFTSVVGRLIYMAQAPFPDLSRYSFITILSFIIMGAFVAGITEEAAFRGYMQAPIERRYGLLPAILIVGIFFDFWHFNHAEVSLINLPYYLSVSAIYGILAYMTGSILPSVVLHVSGNALVDLLLWRRGPSSAAPLIWQSGISVSFLITVAEALFFGIAAILVYKKLERVLRWENHIHDCSI